MYLDPKLIDTYKAVDADLISRMIHDGIFSVGDTFSIVDMVFKLRTRGALFLDDFGETCDLTALDAALALRIVVHFTSEQNPEVNFVKLGANGIELYAKLGLDEKFAIDIKPLDIPFSSLACILGMNQFCIKNNLVFKEFLKKTGPVLVRGKLDTVRAYAYPEFIPSIKAEGLYTGKIRAIDEPCPHIPFDTCASQHNFWPTPFFIQRDLETEKRQSDNGLYRHMKNLAELKNNTTSVDKMLKMLRDYYLNTN